MLREHGYPEWFVRAIQSHGDHTGMARESRLEHTLYACDEVSGFVHACGLVRPDGLATLEARSVRKKLKQPSFARGVNREDVVEGARELGVDLDEHITFVIARAAADLGRARSARLYAGSSRESRYAGCMAIAAREGSWSRS